MKKTKMHLFSVINKAQIFLVILSFNFVLISSIVLEFTCSAELTNTKESLDFCVVIDAGHGGLDPGSIGYKTKVRERDINLSVAKKLEKTPNSVLKSTPLLGKRSILKGSYAMHTKYNVCD